MMEKHKAQELLGKVIIITSPDAKTTKLMKVEVVSENSISSKWTYVKDFPKDSPDGEFRLYRTYKTEIPTTDGYIKCAVVPERVLTAVADAYQDYMGVRDFLATQLQMRYR